MALLAIPLSVHALTIQERSLPVFGSGPVKFICLQIDGGLVPLRPPRNAKFVRGEGSLTVVWPLQKGVATIRTATPVESSLFDKSGKPVRKELWSKTVWSQIDNSALERTEIDFQPQAIDVNHWKISAISVSYQIGAVEACHLLLGWRCRDGSTIAIDLSATPSDFGDLRKQLYEMISSTLVLAN